MILRRFRLKPPIFDRNFFHSNRRSNSAEEYDILDKKFSNNDGLPVITTPIHLNRKAVKLRQRNLEKQKIYANQYGVDLKKSRLIIDHDQEKYRHFEKQKYPPNKPLPLITEHWANKKYYGTVLSIRSTLDRHPSLVKLRHTIKFDDDDKSSNSHSFDSMQLSDEIRDMLKENFEKPTAAQLQSFEPIFSGKNLLLASETGSGKTLAYLAPLIHKLKRIRSKRGPPRNGSPRAIIMAPSLELLTQIFDVFCYYSSSTELNCGLLKDRLTIGQTIDAFDVVILTPGRLKSLLDSKLLDVDSLATVVLDEADTLLDDSFREIVLSTLTNINFRQEAPVNVGCQLLLVSATFPQNLDEFLAGLPDIHNFERISTNTLHKLQPQITHTFKRTLKYMLIEDMLILAKNESKLKRRCLTFVNDNKTGLFLYNFLKCNNVNCEFLRRRLSSGGSHDSDQTFKCLEQFSSGRIPILIATDLGSRGLDTTFVQHVINFDFPRTLADYLHRAGRLGRASVDSYRTPFLCTSFVKDMGDVALVQTIEKAVRLNDGRLTNIFENVKQRFAENLAASSSSLNVNSDDDDAIQQRYDNSLDVEHVKRL